MKNLYYKIRAWVKYHFNRDFFRLLKEVWKGRPWDCGFLYYIEYAKILEMMNYHKRARRFVGWERVVWHMQICLNLIDILTERRELYDYLPGKFSSEKIPDSEYYRLICEKEPKYRCFIHVNTRNVDRFCHNESEKQYVLEHPHELYRLKAKALYHKIRNEQDDYWWD